MHRWIWIVILCAVLVWGSAWAGSKKEQGDSIILLKARSGEPAIAQDYIGGGDGPNGEPARRDPANEIDDGSRTFFSGQPFKKRLKGTGNQGANQFIVQTYISGKPRIVELHVGEDGVIDWNGVAGENNDAHDHWVESFYHVDIKNFNRDDGDTLTVRGHTVSLASIAYKGRDTIIRVRSQQGDGGGAHDEDFLGEIRVRKVHLTDAEVQFVTENRGLTRTFEEFLAIVEKY